MKILHVCASLAPEWGGPVTVVSNLTKSLNQRGVDNTVFATTGIRVGDNPVALDSVETRLFPTGPIARLWLAYAPGLVKALHYAVAQCDLVHIHELWHYPHYRAYQAARRSGKPFVVTIHGELDPWAVEQKALKKRAYMMAIQRRILNRAAALHAITVEEKHHIREQGLIAPVSVIPNGIYPDAFENLPSPSGFLMQRSELLGKQIILFLSRIHPKKGLDILAKAFGEIVKERQDIRLVIAGPDEGGYRTQVEAMLKAVGALDSTVFTGMLTGRDKLSALGAADIFVLPSYGEVLGVATLEAMASGLPVVISRQCQFPEVAEAGAGLVIDTDAGQLRDSLIHLLEHPERRQEMGRRGRQLVLERYNWDAIAGQMIEFYRGILNSSRAQTTPMQQNRYD